MRFRRGGGFRRRLKPHYTWVGTKNASLFDAGEIAAIGIFDPTTLLNASIDHGTIVRTIVQVVFEIVDAPNDQIVRSQYGWYLMGWDSNMASSVPVEMIIDPLAPGTSAPEYAVMQWGLGTVNRSFLGTSAVDIFPNHVIHEDIKTKRAFRSQGHELFWVFSLSNANMSYNLYWNIRCLIKHGKR